MSKRNLDFMKLGAKAEELTHCNECIHSYEHTDARGSWLMCDIGSHIDVKPDFYCAMGENREDE